MMLRALLATSLVVSAPAIPQTPDQSPIPLISCPFNHGPDDEYSAGSAFRIAPHVLISAKHVTDNEKCGIDGQPIQVSYTPPHGEDFVMIKDDRDGKALEVDCNGFVDGRVYVAVGHIRAAEKLTAIQMIGTGVISEDGYAILLGEMEAQPGQSGGPIIDVETGKAVGIVNRADWESGMTASIQLKDTPACEAKP